MGQENIFSIEALVQSSCAEAESELVGSLESDASFPATAILFASPVSLFTCLTLHFERQAQSRQIQRTRFLSMGNLFPLALQIDTQNRRISVDKFFILVANRFYREWLNLKGHG